MRFMHVQYRVITHAPHPSIPYQFLYHADTVFCMYDCVHTVQDQYTIFPFVTSPCNHLSDEDQLRGVQEIGA